MIVFPAITAIWNLNVTLFSAFRVSINMRSIDLLFLLLDLLHCPILCEIRLPMTILFMCQLIRHKLPIHLCNHISMDAPGGFLPPPAQWKVRWPLSSSVSAPQHQLPSCNADFAFFLTNHITLLHIISNFKYIQHLRN